MPLYYGVPPSLVLGGKINKKIRILDEGVSLNESGEICEECGTTPLMLYTCAVCGKKVCLSHAYPKMKNEMVKFPTREDTFRYSKYCEERLCYYCKQHRYYEHVVEW